VTSGQALGEVFLNNVWTSNVAYLASLITTTKINMNNVHMLGNADLINASTGAAVTLATTGTCTFAVPVSTGSGTVTPFGSLNLVADTGVTGYAKVNGTGVIPGMTWTAPSDGRLHTVFCTAYVYITTTEVGGAITLEITSSQAITRLIIVVAGGTAAGMTGIASGYLTGYLVEPGQTVTLQQTTALTSGASTFYGQLWAA